MTKRERLYPEIKRLREEEGLMWREIGARLGLSLKTAQDYYSDPTGEAAHARKAKTNGTCCECGGPTISSGAKVAPTRCRPCTDSRSRAKSRAWIIESMREWARLFGEPPSAADWNPAFCRWRGTPASLRRVERHDSTGRRWPTGSLVQTNFGSWNDGLRAAGYEPLAKADHWGGRNGARRDATEAKYQRIVEMWNEGATYREIARALGVGERTLEHTIPALRLRGYDLPYRKPRSSRRLRALERAA